MTQQKRSGGKFTLMQMIVVVCLLPLLIQVASVAGVVWSYKILDTSADQQRITRQVLAGVGTLTEAEGHGLLAFLRFRYNRQPSDLEAVDRSLNEIEDRRLKVLSDARSAGNLSRAVALNVQNSEQFSKVLQRLADEGHKTKSVDERSADQVIAQLTDIYNEGVRLRQGLPSRNEFAFLKESPIVRAQNSLMLLCSLAMVLNVFLTGGVALALMQFIRRRLKLAQGNCQEVLTGTPLFGELTGNAEMTELDEALIEASQTVAELKQRRVLLSEGASEVLMSLDQQMRVQLVSDSCNARWGYAPDFLTHRNILEVVHPDSTALVEGLVKTCRKDGEAEGEVGIRHRSGMLVHARWSLTWNGPKGQATIVSLDTTQEEMRRTILAEQSAHQRILLESLPVALLIAEPNGIIRGASLQMHELFPHVPDFKGGKVEYLFRGSVKPPVWNDVRASVEPAEALYVEGREQPLSLEVRAHQFSLGDEPLYVVAFEDVSERYEVERFRQEIVATISNEVRTPLATITNMLEMLQADADEAKKAEGSAAAQAARRATAGLIGIVNDMVDIERSRGKRIKISSERIAVRELFSDVFGELESASFDAGVIFPPIGKIDAAVLGDATRLRQTVRELVELLLQFGEEESFVQFSTTDVNENYCDIFLGITASKLTEQEFLGLANPYGKRDPFERTGNPYTRLHVPCAEALVRLMGGRVKPAQVQGALGFIIRLPKAK